MNDAPPPKTLGERPAVGAIVTGVFIFLLSYLAASAQGMATAPSSTASAVAMVMMIIAFALALSGLASYWLLRIRKPTRIANYLAIALLVLAFVVDKALMALA